MPRHYFKYFVFLFCLWQPFIAKAVVAAFTVDNASGCTPLIVHFANTSTDATSYSWNLGNSTTTSVSDPSASYVTAGTYTVTLTAFNGASSSTYSMVITVYPLPTVNFSANFTTRCPGFPVTFTNSSIGGTPGAVSYTWNFGDGSTSTINSPVYAHPSPGFYNITLFATNSRGCFNSLTKPSYIHVFDPPIVNFTGSGTYICEAPSVVAFSNTSSGAAPLSYNWSFGDGAAASASFAPSHNYTMAGSYNVRLRVTDGNGCVDSLFNPGYVYVGNLTASFSSVSGVCEGTAVDFANTSSPHILRDWDFGDGFTSTDEFANHVYTAPGTYNVRLIVNDGSCLDTVIHPITVHPIPSASFTVTPTIPCPTPVTLQYAATISPGSVATWKFLDDAVGTGTIINHTYNVGHSGTRIDTVVLTVTSSFGCIKVLERKDTTLLFMLSVEPSAKAGCAPLTTTMVPAANAVSYNPLTDEEINVPFPYVISGYTWKYGDGSPITTSPTHTYTAAGVYNATCTATTTIGCTAVKIFQILVGVPPVFTCTAVPTHICAGKRVDFTSAGSSNLNSYLWDYGDGITDSGTSFSLTSHLYMNPGKDTVKAKGYYNGCPSPEIKIPILIDSPNAVPSFANACIPRNAVIFGDGSLGADSRLWIFGDGDTSSLPIVTHNFPALLNYTVLLTTYNIASGCRDTVGTEVKLAPPFMYFFSPDTSVCINEDVTFAAVVIGPPAAIEYHWYVDGVLAMNTPSDVTSFPIHTQGLHDITLVILDDRGCFDTFSRYNYILTGNPIASFTASADSGCAPLLVNFPNASTGIPGCGLVSYTWDFGDGNPPVVLTTPLSSHTFTAAGTYSVSLTVTDNMGCVHTNSPLVPVKVFRPHAAFYADFNNVCMGEAVHFNNISASIVSSFWIFGDGNTSSAVSPYHTYTTSGVYTIKLVVTDSHGCNDTATLLNYIYVAPSPHASFTLSDTFAVCPPLNVNFTNTSTGAATYNWNFGNSTSSVAINPSSPYITPGYYTVRLVASNLIGCRDTTYRHVNIFGYTGAFSYTPVSGCMPLPVHFSASLGSFASLVWDFGDGVTSSLALSDTISHTYPSQGFYVPKLILTDTTGCINFSIGSDTIKVDKVMPNFRITPNPVCEGSVTVFSDSSYATFSPPSSWAWSFGGGATGTGATPSYTFTLAGTHVVTLSVTNGNGCTATVTKSVHVNSIPATIAGVRSVCLGYNTTLSNSSPSGTWSSSAPGIAGISSTGVVSGNSVGTATITYTLSAGCISTAVVTVYAVPGAISGANDVCEGGTTTFTNLTTGGVWTSGSPAIATVNSAGLVTGVLSGTAAITYTLGSGCNVNKSITVNATPTPIAGITSVCKNATTTLYESLTGGTWSSGNPSTASIDAGGNVTGVNAGTAGITYAFSTGCKATTVVTVNPLPDTITGDPAMCYGFTTLLADATPGGTWTSGNLSIAVIHPVSGTVLGMAVGTANITYTLSTGCIAVRTVSVNAVPATISGTAVVCENATTMLYQSLPGGNWTSGSPAVATIDAVGLVTGVAAGTARITYAFASGCGVSTVVTVNPLPDTITGNPQLCYGMVSFLGNATPGGTWLSTDPSVAPITSFGAISAISFGTSTISYTLPTGCARNRDVTVNPLPDPISGAMNVCIGNPTHLSSTTTGGTWSSGDTSIATIDMYSGDYTGVAAGLVTVTYTSGAGCIAIATLTIQALPPPILGGPTVCAGFAVNLSNTMPGGVWSSDPALSIIGSVHHFTGVVTGVTPGTVTVTYTVMTGCMRNLVVTVLALPSVISGSPNVCVNDTTFLSDATPGGTWSCSNPSRAVIDPVSGAVAGISAGPAVITYTISTGCFNILHITVNPLPSPIIGPGRVCEGATMILSGSPASGVWISNHTDTATVGYNTGLVTGVSAGTVTISYTLPSGCYVSKLVTVDQTPPAITGNPHVCTGTSVTLANALPGGWWVSGSPTIATVGSATGVVTSVTLGTSYISYIIPATACFAYRIVTVQPLPNVYTVTGGGNYCAGSTGVHVGLTGSQPGVSYVLYYGSSVTGYLSGSGFALDFGSLTPAGLYTVHATNVTSGCQRDMTGSAAIGIIPLVTPVVSILVSPDDTSCPGIPVTVSPLSTNGGTAPVYLWKVNGAIVGGSTAYTFVPADADEVTVTMTSNANCLAAPTATGALTMTVLPSATPVVNVLVSPDDTVCQFIPTTYTAVPLFGGDMPDYMWSVNGIEVGVGPVYTYIPLDGDVVYCSMVSDYLCRLADTVASENIKMSVDPMTPPHVTIVPEPGLSPIAGTPVTLHAIVTNAGAHPGYQWRINGYPVSGATNDSYTAIFEDYDSVVCMVTSHGVCDGIQSFDWVFITARPLDVKSSGVVDAQISLMPNPNNGSFILRGIMPGKASEELSVVVADVLGQIVYRATIVASAGKIDAEISLDNKLANGMYVLNLSHGVESRVFHFVIKQ
jgi:PKD repeat protein